MMSLTKTTQLSTSQKSTFFSLWNAEFPVGLSYPDLAAFDVFLDDLKNKKYYIVLKNEELAGMALQFIREGEMWFSIIVSENYQGQGIGRMLLESLKTNNESIAGWVIDKPGFMKHSGQAYSSPLAFYLKNDFKVIENVRFENEKLSAVRIEWKKSAE